MFFITLFRASAFGGDKLIFWHLSLFC